MLHPPLISIVIPSFQQGDFIESAILSLLAQRYEPLEILVMDGGSHDQTVDILRAYEPRVVWQSQPDQGQSAALNAGFRKTRGEILGWLNSDDMLLPGALHHAAYLFFKEAATEVVYGHCVFVNRDGQFQRYFTEIQLFNRSTLLNWTDFIAQPACFFRRQAYQRAGGLDPSLRFTMDWDLWCRMAKAGAQFVFTNRLLAAARMYRETKTSAGGWQRLWEIRRVSKRHRSTFISYAFLGHLYSDSLKSHRWARFLIRLAKSIGGAVWSKFITSRYGAKERIFGLCPHSNLVYLPCIFQFPWYKPLKSITLRLELCNRQLEVEDVMIRLNGELLARLERRDIEQKQFLDLDYVSPSNSAPGEIALSLEASSRLQSRSPVFRLRELLVR